ncbi:MAG TPA: pyruvate:ferredoxin (flavodoxin) oxidoreductase [Candidatus Sumerlaeota bacterium]|nr:MAG: Pyruvate-flavodoxin oxidoreductase [candidate division BRC1 bacterium ADurb.Bin183]HOE64044.1 pyruvate:ferredoxin (flavodoxin) oxidoreductase [Candidatus Sumerlaeota bacterium]HRR30390.1 pyruvate:ferredoxin (flavodoxin) oxidoreductase [Candidatus Sumerlaeia bacterium]HON51113.1 pyruvate:ferredoxin (flavodoxin) oxidoreductase [Candidatus Sumerlaeota bacterium]HOR65008.1 pyruvate:ferredoxin (flavodoxin) oxidoreductase [Candidatus Sumerlaeota bacterium]
MSKKMVMIDGNSAVAHVAHATNEVIAIYPITPSSNMGEIADDKSAAEEKNIWGTIPLVVELQSEGGASGAVHGALTAGALTTTFTASQGLLLMIPNMFKIAGELTSTVFHVSARSVACQALSIFGDHSDVMAVRSTGFALMPSNSVQEAMDFSLISQAATLESRVPFLHFFDGFRTSHEIQKIEEISFDDMRAVLCEKSIKEHRARGLNPERPVLRGSSQNPDVYFQGRETVNKYYLATPAIVQQVMDRFAKVIGRQYKLFDYVGAPDAERVIIAMGSGCETIHETVEYLVSKGEKVGLIKVRLYRPFSMEHLAQAIPTTANKIAVLDRTKEPGSLGEPLYLDVRSALGEASETGKAKFKNYPLIVSGRYGLSSKEFTPAMVKAVFDNLKNEKPKNHFTVGIIDDVTNTSLDVDKSFSIEPEDVFRGMFYGLGADGTVGANKNSIKIIGTETDNYAQGYFVYDSKKAGAVTVSHLRFGKRPIRSTYLITDSNFVACHNFTFLEKYNMLDNAHEGATFLLNSPYNKDETWDKMPAEVQKQIIDKKLKFYVIDAIKIAEELGLGARINTIMQTAFFKISEVIPPDIAIAAIKDAIQKTYGAKGQAIVDMNIKAVDAALDKIEKVDYPQKVTSAIKKPPVVPEDAPEFVKEVTAMIIAGKGDEIPVSKMPADGSFPTATTQFEKRNIAVKIPVWDPEVCIQCGMCSFVCPHAAIRIKAYDPKCLEGAPATFKSIAAKGKGFENMKFTVQVAPEDCTGCGMCIETCPGKNKQVEGRKAINLEDQIPLRKPEAENFKFFLHIPETDPKLYNVATLKGSQLVRPLFEFSGACAGCGETPYVKLLTQLFGDHLLIGNATGCSSIYGGNLPTTPYCVRSDGRGPGWSNSLFEDNAEFAFGMRLTSDKLNAYALEIIERMLASDDAEIAPAKELLAQIKNADQSTPVGINEQRQRLNALKQKFANVKNADAKELLSLSDFLIRRSIWAVGGDGWAYDIGYGGLDHVLASGKNINALVLDTGVYSNTGGQMSKATPLGAVARFAASGKPLPRKDLGMLAMSYGNIYVAQIAFGANPAQTVRAFAEADAYNGPSLIVAYSHCIAHGINMTKGFENQKRAVQSGFWPLYRFNPDLAKEGKNPLQLDSKETSISFREFAGAEIRFKTLKQSNPERFAMLMEQAEKLTAQRFKLYQNLAAIDCSAPVK